MNSASLSIVLFALFGIALCGEPSGFRHLRYMPMCNSACANKLAAVVTCCKNNNAGNWASCDKFNQAICAWKDIKWSADGVTECVSYPFVYQCTTRWQLDNT
ncbi:unnamed protein product, partial [Mesorhabditis belari]|uniref:Uncharacterized protein n=1 Tax=Mesorhabditis belari TaxID=2138241 RepID=A0A915GNQ1_9BILA